MKLLENRRGLIVGVANERSIAFGIAKACVAHGAKIALTYQNDRLEKRVRPIGEQLGAEWVMPCDLTDPSALAGVRDTIEERWGGLDFVVHAVAFAEKKDLEGRFVDTSAEGFRTAMEASVYTLVALTRELEVLLEKSESGGSIVTLSYYGSQKVIPNYNVMGVAKAALEASVRYLASDVGPKGIRVNAISAGPIKTLSAAGIKGMKGMLDQMGNVTPLGRNVDIEDVGGAAVFALSDLGRGMTGDVIYVDAGYHSLGAWAGDES